jgi:hypothetical protein
LKDYTVTKTSFENINFLEFFAMSAGVKIDVNKRFEKYQLHPVSPQWLSTKSWQP